MNENEPRMLFGKPLSLMLGVVGTAVLFSQIFAIMFTYVGIWLYFLLGMLCIFMMYFLSVGIKHKKTGPIHAYAIFLLIYVMFITASSIVLTIDFVHDMKLPYKKSDSYIKPTDGTRNIEKGYYDFTLVMIWVSASITILLSIYQIRLCILFTRVCTMNRSDNFNVSYQTRFGAPTPTWATMPPGSAPANNQQAGPLPDKPPSYADVTNTPVTVEQPTSLAQSSVVLQTENTQTAAPASMPPQLAVGTIHDDLDTILGRDRPPVIYTGSIMGGAFEAHSPTLPVETIQLQQNGNPNFSAFSDPFDPQEVMDTVTANSAVSDVAAESITGFVPSPTNPFAAEFSAGHANNTNSEVSTETQELGLFEDIHLN